MHTKSINFNRRIFLSTGTLLILLLLFYIVLFFLTNYLSFVSMLWSDQLNDFCEWFYEFLTSHIIITSILLIGLLIILYLYLKNTNNNIKKLFIVVVLICSIFLTFQQGKKISDLKSLGYNIVERIQTSFLKFNQLPRSLEELYSYNTGSDTIKLIKTNFNYSIYDTNKLNIKDYRLFLHPKFTKPTKYIYNEKKKEFINFD